MLLFDVHEVVTVTKVVLRLGLSPLLGVLSRDSASYGCNAVAVTSRRQTQAQGTESR